MGSSTPEVPELPSARGYNWVTLSLADINTEDWSSKLGVGTRFITLSIKIRLSRSLNQDLGLDGYQGYSTNPYTVNVKL
jgi:hypothetical protein